MADYPDEAAGPLGDPNMLGKLQTQWNTFLGDPASQKAMLQMGLALTQPPHFGDTPISQIGRAIGSAGEAQSRFEEEGRKERETTVKERDVGRKEELAGVQSQMAEIKARAEQRQLWAAQNLDDYRKAILKITGERDAEAARNKLSTEWREHVAKTKKGNEEALAKHRAAKLLGDVPGDAPDPKPAKVFEDYDEYVRMRALTTGVRPMGGTTSEVGTGGGGGGTEGRVPIDRDKAESMLRANPTTAMRSHFDKAYGPGSAASVLGE